MLLTKATKVSVLALSLGAVSCGSNDSVDDKDVNEDKIYQQFYISYDAATEKVDLDVQLRMGGPRGTTIKVTEPAKLEIDNTSMNLTDGDKQIFNLTGSYYSFTSQIEDSKKTYQIRWTRQDGKTVLYPITTAPQATPISINSANEVVNRTQDLVVNIDSKKLEEDDIKNKFSDSISCSIKSTDKSARREGDFTYTTGKGSEDLSTCTFDVEKIENFAPGKAEIIVTRRLRATYGGTDDIDGQSRTRVYLSKPLSVIIPE